MKNRGMIIYKESFLTKIIKFFKNLFGKKEDKYNTSNENIEKLGHKEKQDKFINEIKIDTKMVDIDAVLKKENFLKEINGNTEALNMLSVDRLRKLEKYYDSIIEQNEKKIKKLKETA